MGRPRTTDKQVQEILVSNWDGSTPLTAYIKSAGLLVDRMVAAAAALSPPFVHVRDELEMIERILSAYFYTQQDPIYQQKATERASGQFVGAGQSLQGEANRYKRWAIEMDASGCLHALLNRMTAGAAWGGKTPAEAIPACERT
jgi:hypothetical protein